MHRPLSYVEALKTVAHARAQAPSERAAGVALGHLALGKQLYEQGHYSEALGELESALQWNPSLPGALFFKGLVLVALARFSSARDALSQSLALESAQPLAWLALAFVEQELAEPFEALIAVENALAEEPQNGRAHLLKGNLLAALGSPREAMDAYRESIRHAPTLAAPRFKLARLLLDDQQASDAFNQAATALRMNCFDPRSRMAAGELFLANGALQAALVEFTAAADVDPAQSLPHARRGATLFRLGQFAEAEVALNTALSLNPKDYAACLDLARVAHALGRPADADAAIDQARQIDGRYPASDRLHEELNTTKDADLTNPAPVIASLTADIIAATGS
ncbi:MAG: tetratricopeptide repeat protein [Pirellulales bacterium]|nr:tetratricopeptide repeat protein [Pirellulales bacterium]